MSDNGHAARRKAMGVASDERGLANSLSTPNLSNMSIGTHGAGAEVHRQLIIVRKGSDNQCVFANADKLRMGEPVKLNLIGDDSRGVNKLHSDERLTGVTGPWRYIISCIGPKEDSVFVIWEDFNFLRLLNTDLVFDVKGWDARAGNAVNFVGGIPSEGTKTKKYGGGRDWIVNEDGTIALRHSPQFVLGIGDDLGYLTLP
jgi:hypothetical protein